MNGDFLAAGKKDGSHEEKMMLYKNIENTKTKC